jgi:hypothetical protein
MGPGGGRHHEREVRERAEIRAGGHGVGSSFWWV